MTTQKYAAEFKRNGAVCVRDFLSEEWISKVVAGINTIFENPTPSATYRPYHGGAGGCFRDYGNWRTQPELKEFVCQSPTAETVAQLLESTTVTFYHDQVTVKSPRDASQSAFHEELCEFPFSGNQGCTVFVPIDPIPLECTLQLVQGSHQWGRNYFPESVDSEQLSRDMFRDGIEALPNIRALKDAVIMQWNLYPGDVLFYNMKTLVAWNGNVTDHDIRALTTRWLGDDVKYVDKPWQINPPVAHNLKIGSHPSQDSAAFPIIYSDLNTAD